MNTLATFRDRTDAGRELATRLTSYAHRTDVIVLALPRGGIPVACEIAQALDSPMDVMIVRKLGVPGNSELAMGAIASGGGVVLNEDVIHALHIPVDALKRIAAAEMEELKRRERLYRGERPWPRVDGKTVLLVDDGMATGSTMVSAIRALRNQKPARIIVAVPVAPGSTCRSLRAEVDEVVCLMTPSPFMSVGHYYAEFPQLTDDEVRAALRKAALHPHIAK